MEAHRHAIGGVKYRRRLNPTIVAGRPDSYRSILTRRISRLVGTCPARMLKTGIEFGIGQFGGGCRIRRAGHRLAPNRRSRRCAGDDVRPHVDLVPRRALDGVPGGVERSARDVVRDCYAGRRGKETFRGIGRESIEYKAVSRYAERPKVGRVGEVE